MNTIDTTAIEMSNVYDQAGELSDLTNPELDWTRKFNMNMLIHMNT
jgi:hypothetical protein